MPRSKINLDYPNVLGVATNKGDRPSKMNGVITKEYSVWISMVKRCYSEATHRRQKTYAGCSISENFKDYRYFYDWCQSQIGFREKGWHLDKDILLKGNKVYSEHMCIFVPRKINNLFTLRDSKRGPYPIGVKYDKTYNKFYSTCCVNGKRLRSKSYLSPIDAFLAYKDMKEAHIKYVALEFKSRIDPRAYNSLMRWEININD